MGKSGSVEYRKEFEKTLLYIMTGKNVPSDVRSWLNDLALAQYETVLVGNGFDDVTFLVSGGGFICITRL